MLDRLKKKWGIESNFQMIIIFVVFGITGSLSVVFTTPILDFFDLKIQSFEEYYLGSFIYYSVKFIAIFPIYNLLLIIIGALFLQFNFFWSFQKKMFKKIGLGFFFKEEKDS
ncbi:MAG: DUF6787 family protein [Bacteroidota bacterium]|nr:DUF6787 family protein [Bacteroidota bacterium]